MKDNTAQQTKKKASAGWCAPCFDCFVACFAIWDQAPVYLLNLVCLGVVVGSLIAVAFVSTDWYFIPALAPWLALVFVVFHYLEVAKPPPPKHKGDPPPSPGWNNTAVVVHAYVVCNWVFIARAFLCSSIISVTYYLFLNLLWTSNTSLIFTSSTTFSDSPFTIDGVPVFQGFAAAACVINTVVIDSMEAFFTATNYPAVIDALIAFDLIIADVVMFRMRARSYLVEVYPFQKQACTGIINNVMFWQSQISQSCLIALLVLTFLIPLSSFKQARSALHAPIFWLATLVLAVVIGVDLFVIQDVGSLLLGSITQTYRKSINTFGQVVMACLSVIIVFSFLLILPAVKESLLHRRKPKAPPSLNRFLSSQGFVFCLVGLGLSVWIAYAGLPITTVRLVATSTRPPWPSYADFNSFENSVMQSTSLESLLLNVITNTTESVGQGAEQVINLITGFISSAVPSICVDINLGFTDQNVCVGGSDIADPIRSALDGATDQLTGWVIQGETLVIPLILSSLKTEINLVTNGLADIIETGLDQIVNLLGVVYFDLLQIFQQIENVLKFLDNLVPFVPLAITLALFVFEGFIQFFGVASGRHLYLLAVGGLFGGLMVLTWAYFAAQAWLLTVNYKMQIVWNMPVLLLDFVTVEVILIASYMMYTFHDDDIDQDTLISHEMAEYIEAQTHTSKSTREEEHKPLLKQSKLSDSDGVP